MKIKIFFVAFVLKSQFSLAQDVRDIVRFSETQLFGSARFEAMAGSFGALGADLSTSTINPAGFGRYSSSTFGLSFQNTTSLNKALFNGIETNTSINNFRMNNIGFVTTADISEMNNGFIYFQFGFNFNRIQNFSNEYNYEGEQFSSLLDAFCDAANGLSVDEMYNNLPFSSALAWDTYAIDPDGQGGFIPTLGNTNVYHKRKILNKGGISEYAFNFSANYMDKLYIGANLGLRTAKFQENTYHFESANSNPDLSLDSFNYEFNLATKGSGINLKIGAIYLINHQLRLGLSLHSPTSYYNLTDDFSADMSAFHKDSIYRTPDIYKPHGNYKYRIKSAGKVITSLAYVFGTRGAINLDAEFINHNFSKLKSTLDSNYIFYDFKEENIEAKKQLRPVLNIRIGGELVFNSQYFIRGGFALYPSAYDKKINPSKGTQIYTGGIGFRWKKSCLDLSLKLEHRNFNYYAFNASLTELNTFKNSIIINYAVNF